MRRYVAAAFGAFALFATMALTGGPAAAQATIDTTKALGERVLGDPKAPVTILDYSSMTCPHCARFHTETLPKIKETYIDTGKAKLVFRDFPFDQWALRASMLARCAPPERYFPLLDVLFKGQAQWASAKDPGAALTQIGKLAGLSEATIKACWEDKALADGILNSRLEGQNKDKVESTPTFILTSGSGTTKVEGAQPFEKFAEAIDKLAK
ncbi:DsbA family protein [Azospirillum sp.]|uniref:DsbA family protein n=1 Tax=Azospirillum sp. TaxID=34012 RepID=UPI003D73BC1E